MSVRLCAMRAGLRSAVRLAAVLAGIGAAVTAFGQKPGPKPAAKPAGPNPKVSVVIEHRGTIVVEMEPRYSPKGILFHRVLPNFVAQAGDPKSRSIDGAKLRGISDSEVAERYNLGGGGSGQTVPLENSLSHERGTLGLARSQSVDSGDSQFFFNLKANHDLDGGYCVFGKVVKGTDVMDAIQQGDRIKSIRALPTEKHKR
jgi:cyclophilin family peptidyl-prolyl cis-trans isomerase